jgi:hypothetical protein
VLLFRAGQQKQGRAAAHQAFQKGQQTKMMAIKEHGSKMKRRRASYKKVCNEAGRLAAPCRASIIEWQQGLKELREV